MPFVALQAASPLAPATLLASYERESAKLAETRGCGARFASSLRRDAYRTLYTSQHNSLVRTLHQLFGQGAHKLHVHGGAICDRPSLESVGPLAYLSIRQPMPLRAAYAWCLEKVFGAGYVEPRMLRIVDRVAYWSAAAASELGALVGIGLRYALAAVFLLSYLPFALYRATLTRLDAPHALSMRGDLLSAGHELRNALLWRQLRAPTESDLALYEVPRGFSEAVKGRLVTLEGPELGPAVKGMSGLSIHAASANVVVLGGLSDNLPPAPQAMLRYFKQIIPVEDAHRQVVAACGHNMLWARSVMLLATQDSLRLLASSFADAERLQVGRTPLTLLVDDAAQEIRIHTAQDGVVRIALNLDWTSPHRLAERYNPGIGHVVHAGCKLSATLHLREPQKAGEPLHLRVTDATFLYTHHNVEKQEQPANQVYIG